MEPLAHTLVGACLAETGLKRVTPLAASTLIIAANLPDIDGACYLYGADLAFDVRRGLTHGLLAWVLLPVLLVWAMLALDHLVRRRFDPAAAPARSGPLLGLSVMGVLSHPFLDWLNTYGIRLLMPFSDRWFYGDTLFIVDPWLWLVLGGVVMLSTTTARRGVVTWVAIGTGTTLLLVLNPLVPAWVRAVWLAVIGALVAMRFIVPERIRSRLAVWALVLAGVYIGVMFAGSRLAERQVWALVHERGWKVDRLAAMPVPAEPLRRTVIAVTPDEYLFVALDWTRGPSRGVQPLREPRGPYDPIVAAALDLPDIQGTRRWLRFPSYEVHQRRNGLYRVTIRDARFAVGNRSGFGVVATVDVDKQLRAVRVR